MLYSFNGLIEKVKNDPNGVGAVFYRNDGTIERRIYENMKNYGLK